MPGLVPGIHVFTTYRRDRRGWAGRRRTAQSAISRRIALRHGAAPRLAPRTEGGPRRGSPLERWFNPRGEHRGSSRSKPLKPSRAERRMCPVLSWRRHSCAFYFLHTGLRTHRASGVPRPLSTGRMELRKPRTWKHAARMRSRVWRSNVESDVSKSRIPKLAFRR